MCCSFPIPARCAGRNPFPRFLPAARVGMHILPMDSFGSHAACFSSFLHAVRAGMHTLPMHSQGKYIRYRAASVQYDANGLFYPLLVPARTAGGNKRALPTRLPSLVPARTAWERGRAFLPAQRAGTRELRFFFRFTSAVQRETREKTSPSGDRHQTQSGSTPDLVGVGARPNRGRQPTPTESDADHG
uniref:Uncharacterized protein n=1 Tax=Candidatus Kentrum sp. MB TaxID=2138164 RepID=A0A450XT53_9GAMM|nr:MAG: hypothetical protein BECKMB1821I_GA0114274_102736 [Candidatus Kentron sp. MB]VFK32459.1 MAG: hypothetical protein BECKMB1821G_GA0114241_11133 [Candidatus Kentron sp. MB]VFK75592.1 MAG: hypothetical protein BECKMB1821H_GA0114242_102636 [Candidatus Kentron sp. MB]